MHVFHAVLFRAVISLRKCFIARGAGTRMYLRGKICPLAYFEHRLDTLCVSGAEVTEHGCE